MVTTRGSPYGREVVARGKGASLSPSGNWKSSPQKSLIKLTQAVFPKNELKLIELAFPRT